MNGIKKVQTEGIETKDLRSALVFAVQGRGKRHSSSVFQREGHAGQGEISSCGLMIHVFCSFQVVDEPFESFMSRLWVIKDRLWVIKGHLWIIKDLILGFGSGTGGMDAGSVGFYHTL
jgi:hypothetical protein